MYDLENYIEELEFRLQKSLAKTNELIEQHKIKMKSVHDKTLGIIDIKIGDKIRDESIHKLEPVYMGPYTVQVIEKSNIIAIDEKKTSWLVFIKNEITNFE